MLSRFIASCLLCFSACSFAELGPALPVYTESQLLRLFEKNQQLAKVKADKCQLVQDIEARAIKLALPTYQFLYADMLAWGVCIERDVDLGLYYMEMAARQGLDAALEQLGRYYSKGILVQKDKTRAIPYLREAASLGNLKARLLLAELLINDFGSPLDYEDAYHWLFHTVTANKLIYQRIVSLRLALEARMPSSVVNRAKKRKSQF